MRKGVLTLTSSGHALSRIVRRSPSLNGAAFGELKYLMRTTAFPPYGGRSPTPTLGLISSCRVVRILKASFRSLPLTIITFLVSLLLTTISSAGSIVISLGHWSFDAIEFACVGPLHETLTNRPHAASNRPLTATTGDGLTPPIARKCLLCAPYTAVSFACWS